MKTAIIIPASSQSKRILCKPLVQIAGRPLIDWTVERASQCNPDRLIVATDSEEIYRQCDCEAFLSSQFKSADKSWLRAEQFRNGTQRCADAVRALKLDYSNWVVINWQVDEPLLNPQDVIQLQYGFGHSESRIATLVSREEAVGDSNTVRCHVNNQAACWFSRAPLAGGRAHLGIYAFETAKVLQDVAKSPESEPGRAENLEQLDWLCCGHRMLAVYTDASECVSINTYSDIERMEEILRKDRHV